MKLDESADYIHKNRGLTSLQATYEEPDVESLGITKVTKTSLNRLGIYLPHQQLGIKHVPSPSVLQGMLLSPKNQTLQAHLKTQISSAVRSRKYKKTDALSPKSLTRNYQIPHQQFIPNQYSSQLPEFMPFNASDFLANLTAATTSNFARRPIKSSVGNNTHDFVSRLEDQGRPQTSLLDGSQKGGFYIPNANISVVEKHPPMNITIYNIRNNNTA